MTRRFGKPRVRPGSASRPRRNGLRRDRTRPPATAGRGGRRRRRRTGPSSVPATSFRSAMDQEGQCAFVHRIFALHEITNDLSGPWWLRKIFPLSCRKQRRSLVFQPNRDPSMLYAILCYHDEDIVGSWTREQDAAVMTKLSGRAGQACKTGPARPGGAAAADDVGDHAAQGRSARGDRRPLCRDQGAAARLLPDRLQQSRRARSTSRAISPRPIPAAPTKSVPSA